MRFDKDTRAQIQGAAPGSTTIRWPAGEREPQKGRVYWMQALEDIEKAERRLEEHPETCRDVMAQMYRRQNGGWPEGYKPPKPQARRPRKEDPCILVLDVAILERGWEATVVLYEDADPIRHTGIKARVPAGPNPIDGFAEKTELEQEQIVVRPSRSEREDEADSMRLEHEASTDALDVAAAESKLKDERRRGKPGRLAAAALDRARRRTAAV